MVTALMEDEFIGYETSWNLPPFGILPLNNYGVYASGYFIPPIDGKFILNLYK